MVSGGGGVYVIRCEGDAGGPAQIFTDLTAWALHRRPPPETFLVKKRGGGGGGGGGDFTKPRRHISV